MIIFVMVCTLILLGLAEHASRRDDLRRLHVKFSIDSELTEPDEVVTLRYTVYNTSRLPVLYAGLSLELDPEVVICEDETWLAEHAHRDFLGTRIDHHFYLLPYRRFRGKVRISFRKRGTYELGRYYLERGYRRFAYIAVPDRRYWSGERRRGFVETLAAAGFGCAAGAAMLCCLGSCRGRANMVSRLGSR